MSKRLTEAEKLARMLARLGLEDITESVNSRGGYGSIYRYALVVKNPVTNEIVGQTDIKRAWRWLRAERHYQLTGKY